MQGVCGKAVVMGGGPARVVLHVLVFVIALFLYNVVLTTPAQLHADGPRCLALSSLADDEWTGLYSHVQILNFKCTLAF